MKKTILSMSAALLTALAFSGCNAENNAARLQNNANFPQRPIERRVKINEDDETPEQQHLSAEARAEIIADGIENMAEIEEAYVVLTGSTAIVGIKIFGESDDAHIIEIKTLVDKETKAIDPAIEHVAVTASPELVGRIIEMVGGEQTPAESLELDQFKDDELFFRVAPTI